MTFPRTLLCISILASSCTSAPTDELGEPAADHEHPDQPAGDPLPAGDDELVLADTLDSEVPPSAFAVAAGCVAQPTGMKWQTPWDNTNRYFTTAGLSQAGPYFYGEPGTHHVGCTGTYPQHYAIDWFTSHGTNIYSSIPGKVIWAGESPNPANSLGRYVAVEHWYGGNRYVAIHAHLSEVYVRPGQIIRDSWNLDDPNSLPNVVIGRAGRTDVPAGSVTHLHHSTLFNPSFDGAGEPFGGRSVMPRRIRCFGCTNVDGGKGGYYSGFLRARRYLW